MSESAVCSMTVDQCFSDLGLSSKSLGELELPDTLYGYNGKRGLVPYNQCGDRDAPNVIIESAPYLTDVNSPHFKLRLSGHQAVLGDEYSVIGVQAFDPEADFSLTDRQKLATGNFSPLSERMIRVAESACIKADQRVIPDGYSLGGDVAIQLAHDVISDENKGVLNISSLSASEYARWGHRGAVLAIDSMMRSGKDLLENVKASRVPALLEAWDIDTGISQANFGRRVCMGALKYLLNGKRNNLAIIRGFGTDVSDRQLKYLAASDQIQGIVLNANKRSTVCSLASQENLAEKYPKVAALTGEADHSGDDNIRQSAISILQTMRKLDAINEPKIVEA